jgi:transportin-3
LLRRHFAPRSVFRLQFGSTVLTRCRQVIYDLVQLDQSQLFALKETILTALDHSQAGPKAIQTQLSLAVSALALQLIQWTEPIQNIIQRYSHNPAAVPLLLEFLRVLPEEINGNTKIPVSVSIFNPSRLRLYQTDGTWKDSDFRVRSVSLLTDNAAQVLQLLVLYAQAPGEFGGFMRSYVG